MPATNCVIEQIHKHASVRHYAPDPLPRAVVETVVAAGQCAATSSNLQMYSVVAVTDAATRKHLAHVCGEQVHIAEAPVFLAWCADLHKLQRASELRDHAHVHDYAENFILATVDVALAAQNAALAAESLGLGICYIGGIRDNPRDVIRVLKLPRLVFPIAGMTLGRPARAGKVRPRLPMRAVLHWESFDDAPLDDALREYDQAMIATGIYNNRQVPVPSRPGETEDYGWTEHSSRRVSKPNRVTVGEVLREQGFDFR